MLSDFESGLVRLTRPLSKSLNTVDGFSCCAPAAAFWISVWNTAEYVAVAANFPNALHRGCHFHFCQAIYRKAQAYGLCGIYDSEPQMRLQVRQLMALAFLPVAIVRLTYRTLQLHSDGRLQPLFLYFEQQWLT